MSVLIAVALLEGALVKQQTSVHVTTVFRSLAHVQLRTNVLGTCHQHETLF